MLNISLNFQDKNAKLSGYYFYVKNIQQKIFKSALVYLYKSFEGTLKRHPKNFHKAP